MLKEVSNIYEYKTELFKAIINNNNMDAVKFLKVENFNFWEVAEDNNFTELLFDRLKPDKRVHIIKQFINRKTDNGDSALAYASYRGNIEIIKLLITHGADIYSLTNTGQNVLHIAAQGDQPESIIYFKEKFGMDINIKDHSGSTPLHWACHTGSELSLNFLISYGADVNSRDAVGITPLHLSAISEKIRIIKKLLQNGADKHIVDNKGRTPYIVARDRNKTTVLELLEDDKSTLRSILCFDQHIRKTEKSSSNVIIFLVLHVFVESIVYCTILPLCSNRFEAYFYIFYFIYLIVIFINLINSNPGRLHGKKSSLLHLVENHANIVEYCPICIVQKSMTSMHCIICDICIEDFDHHCFWVNNCIGGNNLSTFIIFLLSIGLTYVDSSIIIEHKFFPNVYYFVENTSYSVLLLIQILILILATIFFVPVTILTASNIRRFANAKPHSMNTNLQLEKLKVKLLEEKGNDVEDRENNLLLQKD